MAEPHAAGFGPDVLTPSDAATRRPGIRVTTADIVAATGEIYITQTDAEFYRRKKSSVVVRHVSDDRIDRRTRDRFAGQQSRPRSVSLDSSTKSATCSKKIHLLIVDPFPPTRRDSHGIHAAIWQELVKGAEFHPSAGKPLTLVAYESDEVIKAFVEPIAVGDVLPAMPLILEPDGAVQVPLAETYQSAWQAVPRRWQRVLEG